MRSSDRPLLLAPLLRRSLWPLRDFPSHLTSLKCVKESVKRGEDLPFTVQRSSPSSHTTKWPGNLTVYAPVHPGGREGSLRPPTRTEALILLSPIEWERLRTEGSVEKGGGRPSTERSPETEPVEGGRGTSHKGTRSTRTPLRPFD